jgi:hypothetical protein
MSYEHRRFLFLEQGRGSVVVNLAINGVIAFLAFHGAAHVPLWGQQSIAADTLVTCFLLPFFTSLVVTRAARGRVRAGRVPPFAGAPFALHHLPATSGRRGAVLGVASALVVGLPAVAALAAFGVSQQSFWEFVLFNAVFAAALGAVVTPLIALWAICEPKPLAGV